MYMENKGYVVLSAEAASRLFKFLTKLPYETVQGLIPTLVKDIEDTKQKVVVVPKALVEAGPETAEKDAKEMENETEVTHD